MADTDIGAINKNTYNFYLVIEVPDHVYVLVGKILPIRIKDIYMIRYFYHKIEIIRVFFNNCLCYIFWYTKQSNAFASFNPCLAVVWNPLQWENKLFPFGLKRLQGLLVFQFFFSWTIFHQFKQHSAIFDRTQPTRTWHFLAVFCILNPSNIKHVCFTYIRTWFIPHTKRCPIRLYKTNLLTL